MSELARHPSISQSRPQVFKTGGVFALMGLWFLLIGLVLTGGSIAAAILAPSAPGVIWLRVLLLVFTAIPLGAAVLGFLMLFGGERITVDAGAGEVHVSRGRWWTWKRETRPLSEFHAVEIHRQSSNMGSRRGCGGQATHPIRMVARADEIELADIVNYHKARALAERVADYTGLPLHEATERETIIREAGMLNESIAERARRLGDDVEWPKLPRGSRIELHHYGDTTHIVLPRPNPRQTMEGLLGMGFLLIVYGGGLAGIAYIFGTWLTKAGIVADGGIGWAVLWALPIVPVVYIGLFGAALLIGRECVSVSPRVFKRAWRFPFVAWMRRIPADQIEELLGNTDDVIVRTDRTTCRVGFVLNKQERRWLAAAIRYVLVKGPPVDPSTSSSHPAR